MELWEHQKQAVVRARRGDCFALFFEMGTGKTPTAISILKERFFEHGYLRTLILTPLVTIENWKEEFSRWMPEAKIICLIGTKNQRLKLWNSNKDKDAIFLLNYEGLNIPSVCEWLLEWRPQVIIFDESHRCKNHQAKRTKIAIKLSDKALYRYILTGTPILNSSMDVFSQFRILDKGQRFSKNFYQFRATYFYDNNAGMPSISYFPDWRMKPGMNQEISAKMAEVSMQVKKEQCLDLPPFVKETVRIKMGSQQARVYRDMEKDFVSYVNNDACMADFAMVKALRLMQIVSGFVGLESGEIHTFDPNPRNEALQNILEQLTDNHKVIIWACFRQNYEDIRRVLKNLNLDWVEVHGDVPNAEKFEAIKRFNGSADCRVFVGHPGSGGIGVNLTVASYSIWYSRSFSLEHYLQANARNYRGGSKEQGHQKVTSIELVCPETMDEIVLEALANKKEIGETILKAYRK